MKAKDSMPIGEREKICMANSAKEALIVNFSIVLH
jgi:hypothetical protein